MIPLLARAPDLPYVFAPPDGGAIETWAIVWSVYMLVEVTCRSLMTVLNIPIG